MHAIITDLYIYPVKSLAGIRLSKARALPSGLEGDRQWAIFTASGTMFTQRQDARLALIQVHLDKGDLWLSAPDMDRVRVTVAKDAVEQSLRIWSDDCRGLIATREANQWLNDFLQTEEKLALYKAAPDTSRQFKNPARFGVNAHYFSDAAPYLITNSASLDRLNTHFSQQQLALMDMRHFRSNIVITAAEAFCEQSANFLSAEDTALQFKLVDYCQRCMVITVLPDKGEYLHSKAWLQAVAEVNSMPDNNKAPAFGINSSLVGEEGLEIGVGQRFLFAGN